VKTAAQAAQAWRDSQGKATTNYSAGVAGYSGDWAGATVAQESVALSNITQAFTSGRWRQGVQAVGTNGWKQATEAKKGNYGTGFSAGADRQAAAAQKIISALGNIVPSLPPRGTFDQNLDRARVLATAMHSLKGQLGAR
jgi:hypothetical protein